MFLPQDERPAISAADDMYDPLYGGKYSYRDSPIEHDKYKHPLSTSIDKRAKHPWGRWLLCGYVDV